MQKQNKEKVVEWLSLKIRTISHGAKIQAVFKLAIESLEEGDTSCKISSAENCISDISA